jgi:hypothetical protein
MSIPKRSCLLNCLDIFFQNSNILPRLLFGQNLAIQ